MRWVNGHPPCCWGLGSSQWDETEADMVAKPSWIYLCREVPWRFLGSTHLISHTICAALYHSIPGYLNYTLAYFPNLASENENFDCSPVGMNMFNSLALGDVAVIFKNIFLNSLYRIVAWAHAVKLPSDKCHKTLLMRSNIGSSNDMVPSGIKPLLEPMLNQIYVTIWRH